MPATEFIVIRGLGSISSLGFTQETVTEAYLTGKTGFQNRLFNSMPTPVGALSAEAEELLRCFANEKKAYAGLDKSVLLAMYASRQAIAQAGWEKGSDIAVNIGSSRGATGLFEHYISEFQALGKVPASASPVTTLGNISSWVANDLQASGPVISHSVTCSTALQAIANGFAWLKAGMATKFLAGGTEAPLTPFTIAQMKAIGIYSEDINSSYPCRPQNIEKKNTFVLGEGASVFALEKTTDLRKEAQPIAVVEGIGFGFEEIKSKTGISASGLHFQLAMQQALRFARLDKKAIDVIIMHSPGTAKGDAAELRAIKAVFGENNSVKLTSNKWQTGHTLGASAALSLEYGLHILKSQTVPAIPYPSLINSRSINKMNKVMILGAGFGGNASALIISLSV